jgi:CTP:molybdopterin cytidylyltransferase MocA
MPVAAIVIATARTPWSDSAMALLPWTTDTSLIEFHIEQLKAAGVRDIEVVLGHEADSVIPLVAADNVEPIINDRWAVDAASSLRAGASAVVRGTTAAVVLDVAEPRPAQMVRALIDEYAAGTADVTLATFHGERATPVILGEHALSALRNVHGRNDLWSIVGRYAQTAREVRVEGTFSGIVRRIDSKEAFDRAREALRAR